MYAYQLVRSVGVLLTSGTPVERDIMELEKQVCSLELAKKLKELGLKQESYFWWFQNARNGNWMMGDASDAIKKDGKKEIPSYSAFTVAELGEMLPREEWGADSMSKKYRVWWKRAPVETDWIENTEADARAEMLVYLLENKLIAA
jgi:hypothetical protein